MTAKQWVLVLAGALVLTGVLAHFQRFRDYEYVAIWLEGIALVLIFGLDFFERVRQVKERKEQQDQWVEQMELSRNQLQAATNAALAAKKSADIQAALHRPLLGLEPPTVNADINAEVWTIGLTIKNHGSLAALNSTMIFEFLINDNARFTSARTRPVEIFPQDAHTVTADFTWDSSARLSVLRGESTFKISVKIAYDSDDERHFEFTCDGRYFRQKFVLENSKTIFTLKQL